MLRGVILATAILLCLPGRAAEKVIDFSRFKLNEMPQGFRSLVTGSGKPGDWLKRK